jgi:hypothetical protein
MGGRRDDQFPYRLYADVIRRRDRCAVRLRDKGIPSGKTVKTRRFLANHRTVPDRDIWR